MCWEVGSRARSGVNSRPECVAKGSANVRILDMGTEIFTDSLFFFNGLWSAVDTKFVSGRRRAPVFVTLCKTQVPAGAKCLEGECPVHVVPEVEEHI